MTYQKHKNSSFFVCGRHYSGTLVIEAVLTKTGRSILGGEAFKCNRKTSMVVSHDTLKVE